MTTATEQLQAIVNAWAERLGVPAHLSVTVYSPNYCGNTKPRYRAAIGGICGPEWSAGNEIGMEDAIKDSEGQWMRDGAPTDFSDKEMVEKIKIKARCKELGIALADDRERDEPVIYNRGEIAAADSRTEHDKSL